MEIERCIPIESREEWKGALKGIKHAFAHTWENCYAMHLTTNQKTYLYCYESEKNRIICPISERQFEGFVDIVTPFGFSGFTGIADCAEFPQVWKNYVTRKGYVCGFLTLNPLLENKTYFKNEEATHYNDIFAMDLSETVEALFSRLDRNRKRRLRRWEDIKSSLILDREIVGEFFLRNYSEFFRRKNASNTYQFSQDTISFLLSSANVILVGAGKEGKVVAVAIFSFSSDIGEYFLHFSLPGEEHHSATLIWYAVHVLKSKGIRFLNLGGGVRPNDGIADFKRDFGGKKLPLRCLKQIYQPDIYERLCSRVHADPARRTDFFPLYQAP